jgi:hypothetical protein
MKSTFHDAYRRHEDRNRRFQDSGATRWTEIDRPGHIGDKNRQESTFATRKTFQKGPPAADGPATKNAIPSAFALKSRRIRSQPFGGFPVLHAGTAGADKKSTFRDIYRQREDRNRRFQDRGATRRTLRGNLSSIQKTHVIFVSGR